MCVGYTMCYAKETSRRALLFFQRLSARGQRPRQAAIAAFTVTVLGSSCWAWQP